MVQQQTEQVNSMPSSYRMTSNGKMRGSSMPMPKEKMKDEDKDSSKMMMSELHQAMKSNPGLAKEMRKLHEEYC